MYLASDWSVPDYVVSGTIWFTGSSVFSILGGNNVSISYVCPLDKMNTIDLSHHTMLVPLYQYDKGEHYDSLIRIYCKQVHVYGIYRFSGFKYAGDKLLFMMYVAPPTHIRMNHVSLLQHTPTPTDRSN